EQGMVVDVARQRRQRRVAQVEQDRLGGKYRTWRIDIGKDVEERRDDRVRGIFADEMERGARLHHPAPGGRSRQSGNAENGQKNDPKSTNLNVAAHENCSLSATGVRRVNQTHPTLWSTHDVIPGGERRQVEAVDEDRVARV